MFCKECGKYIQNDQKFCPYCGVPVEIPIEEMENTPEEKKLDATKVMPKINLEEIQLDETGELEDLNFTEEIKFEEPLGVFDFPEEMEEEQFDFEDDNIYDEQDEEEGVIVEDANELERLKNKKLNIIAIAVSVSIVIIIVIVAIILTKSFGGSKAEVETTTAVETTTPESVTEETTTEEETTEEESETEPEETTTKKKEPVTTTASPETEPVTEAPTEPVTEPLTDVIPETETPTEEMESIDAVDNGELNGN